MNGFVADESVGDRRDNEAMFERYSARARSVIFLPSAVRGGVVPLTSSPGTSCTPWSVRTGETSPPPQNCLLAVRLPWSGSAVTKPPFFPDDVAEKLLRTLEDLPNRDPAAKDDMPVSRS